MTTFLHIGLPKTGTTVLQKYLTANRELLSTHGLSFPNMAQLGAPQSAIGHHFFAHELAKSDKHIPKFREFLRSLPNKDTFLSAEPFARHAVLSTQGVYDTWADKGRYISRVRAAVGVRNVQVIITLRQAHLMAESAYKELIKKSTTTESFATFIATRFYGYDFRLLIDVWQRQFPSIKIRIFEDDIANEEGLVGAMIRPICVSLPKIATLPIENNALSPMHTEFKRLLNSGTFSASDMAIIVDALSQLGDKDTQKCHPSLWSYESLAAFQPRIDQGNLAIAEMYFGGKKSLFPKIDFEALDTFSGISTHDFAGLLDALSDNLPHRLTDEIVRHLAQHMQSG